MVKLNVCSIIKQKTYFFISTFLNNYGFSIVSLQYLTFNVFLFDM